MTDLDKLYIIIFRKILFLSINFIKNISKITDLNYLFFL